MKKKTLNLLILNLVITVGIWGAYFYIIHQTRATSASFEDMKNKINELNKLQHEQKALYLKGSNLNDKLYK